VKPQGSGGGRRITPARGVDLRLPRERFYFGEIGKTSAPNSFTLEREGKGEGRMEEPGRAYRGTGRDGETVLATGFTPVTRPRCALFPPVSGPVCAFRKTSAFPRVGMRVSFAGNRFPRVKSADEFPASFPPSPRRRAAPAPSRCLSLCACSISGAFCWDAEYIDTSRCQPQGGWLNSAARTEQFFTNRLMEIFGDLQRSRLPSLVLSLSFVKPWQGEVGNKTGTCCRMSVRMNYFYSLRNGSRVTYDDRGELT